MEHNYSFTYQFADQQLAELYRTEQRVSRLFKYFSIFAIFISCLGLFGLASFMTEQRQKEIGIRKVLGSKVDQIVMLLSREFSRWLLLAGIIGLPLAYFAMDKWLQSFYYKTEINVLSFVIALIIVFAVALLTVSIQTFRASIKNPVDTLRNE